MDIGKKFKRLAGLALLLVFTSGLALLLIFTSGLALLLIFHFGEKQDVVAYVASGFCSTPPTEIPKPLQLSLQKLKGKISSPQYHYITDSLKALRHPART